MMQVEPEEAEPQPEEQSLTPPCGVFLFTFQPVEFNGSSQLRETESYLKNWDLSGLTRRQAGQTGDGGEEGSDKEEGRSEVKG